MTMKLGSTLGVLAVRTRATAAILTAKPEVLDEIRRVLLVPRKREERHSWAVLGSRRSAERGLEQLSIADELLFSPCSAMGTVGGFRSRNEEHSA
jgi:hypothetical protein